EVPLRLERCLEPAEQAVKRLAELPEFVVGAVNGETLAQVSGGDPGVGRGDRAQWPQDAPGYQPADPHSEGCHDHDQDQAGHVLLGVVTEGPGEGQASALAAGVLA